jgi:hypothetical protein
MWGDLPGTAVAVCCTAAVAGEPRRPAGPMRCRSSRRSRMAIRGGFELHRRQLTYDDLDVVTGEVERGRVVPADRGHLRSFLARFEGRVRWLSRWRAGPAGGRWWRSWSGPASGPIWPSRRRRRPSEAASAAPRPIGATPATCGSCWPRATCPARGSRRRRCWRPGRGCGRIRTWRRSARRGCSGPGTLDHQGVPVIASSPAPLARPASRWPSCRPPASRPSRWACGSQVGAPVSPGPLRAELARCSRRQPGCRALRTTPFWDRPDHLGGHLGRDGRPPPLLLL